MLIKSADFVKSSAILAECPKSPLPEYAFIGRSNVGKSSLTNMLCGRSKLAKVSSTPGKTRLINHYLVNENWHLVDLPGYGFAKVSRSEREKWGSQVEEYLLGREQLQYVMVLVDSRLEPQKIDVEFICHLGVHDIAQAIVFTKIDKISPAKLQENYKLLQEELLKFWEELPPFFFTSAEKKLGREEVLAFIDQNNREYQATLKAKSR